MEKELHTNNILRNRMFTKYLFSALCLTISSVALSQSWTKVASLPTSASISDLTVNSDQKIYAVNQHLGELYVSSDNGQNWSITPGSELIHNISELNANTSESTVLVGTLYRGLFWTTNNGASWQNEPFYTNQQSGLNAYIANAAKKNSIMVCHEPLVLMSKIYKSVNSGQTWTEHITSAFSDGNDLTFLSNGNLVIGTLNGVFRSINNGETWSPLNTGITNMCIVGIEEDVTNGRLYAAVGKNPLTNNAPGAGCYVSTDNGVTWSSCSNGLDGEALTSLTLNNGTLYCTTNSKVFKSTDNGQSWTQTATGNSLVTSIGHNQGVFTGSLKTGIRFNPSNTTDWFLRNNGIQMSTFTEVLGGPDFYLLDGSKTGLFRSANNDWEAIDEELPAMDGVAMTQDDSGNLYISYTKDTTGVYTTLDNGQTWQNITSIPISGNPNWVRFSKLKAANDAVYAVSDESYPYQAPAVYRSTDNGTTWSVIFTLDINSQIRIDDIVLDGNGEIYLSIMDFSSQLLILHSADGGGSFDTIPVTIFPVTLNWNLRISETNELFVCTNSHVYQYNPAIESWTQLVDGNWTINFGFDAMELYMGSGEEMFVVAENEGVFRSIDGGESWTNINYNLPLYSGPFIPLSPVPFDKLWIGNDQKIYGLVTQRFAENDRGIYRFNETSVGLSEEQIALMQVFPNPATDKLTIALNADFRPTHVRITDVSGRCVFEQTIELINNNMIELSIASLPTGMLLLEVSSEIKTEVRRISHL